MATVVLNRPAINLLLRGRGGEVVRHLEDIGRRAENIAKATAPKDTGHLAQSVTHRVDTSFANVSVDVFSNVSYAPFQELGTGVFAGRGPIRPKRGQFLVFRPKGGAGPVVGGRRPGAGGLVFARQVRGVPPTHFMENALRAASPYPVSAGRR